MITFIQARNFVKKNEKYISPIALFGGFVIDSFTLQRIDLLFENIILGSYLILSGLFIFIISLIDIGKIKNSFLVKIRPFMGIILLVFLGGIFSGFTIFYVRSANFFSAWPFLFLLIGVMVGTEYLKKYFTRMTILFSVFYFALFSYLIFLVPIIIKKIGPGVFILSGVISLLVIYGYVRLFEKFAQSGFKNIKIDIFRLVSGVFVLVNILYFTNIIPPIPLSLKDADVYHYIERSGSQYTVLDEKRSFFDRITLHEKVRIQPGESLYLFSSVFAPTRLSTQIVHEWQFKDKKGKWVTSSKIPFGITGGSDTGYRGYSVKSGLKEGEWRVNIETPRGQIIGRKNFKVSYVEGKQTLFSEIK
jgi:hypothetical protein